MSEIIELKNKEDWENLKSECKDKYDLLVFKYSPICTVSFTAGKILETWLKYKNTLKNLKVSKINVIDERPVSKIIEEETGIRHESPQLIWFDANGNIKWHGSHFMITENNLMNQLNKPESKS